MKFDDCMSQFSYKNIPEIPFCNDNYNIFIITLVYDLIILGGSSQLYMYGILV